MTERQTEMAALARDAVRRGRKLSDVATPMARLDLRTQAHHGGSRGTVRAGFVAKLKALFAVAGIELFLQALAEDK